MILHANDFQDKEGSGNDKKHKISFLSAFIVVCFFLYTIRLFSMQVIEGSNYRQQSENISQRSKIIPAQRGEIYDRSETYPLVTNRDSFAIDIIPAEIPSEKFDTVTEKLSQLLKISKKQIDEKIPKSLRHSYNSIEIKSNVGFDVVSNIAENSNDLPGISWKSKPIRNYLETGSFSHIFGYTGNITKEELKVMYNKGYTSSSIIGKTGIEKQYDKFLQGKNGVESRTVDVRGKLILADTLITSPEMGKNLVLTIDSTTQILAEKALGNRVGAIVVLKPATGEILASVSYPYFNANLFNSDESASVFSRLMATQNNPLLNRVVNASYPPASTFKTIMSTALLAEETFDPEKTIECTGSMFYGDREFKCHIGKPGHGHLNLKDALAQSCNVYFWTIGRDYLGVDRISSYAKEFGLGQSLEVDLPAQTNGFIPTAQWKERRFHESWLGGDTMSLSIGQGYTLASPLHIANMMAMIVNKGTIYTPHLLKKIIDPLTGEVVKETSASVLHTSTIQEKVWNTIQEYLRYMVTDGSAQFPLKNKVVQIAGKTGTAEVTQYKDRWHSWFVGYGPYGADPKDTIVVCTLVEAINPWEWWGPYAANIVFQGYFANQTYEEAVASLGFSYLTKPRGRQE